jgi:hypothetical protein
MLDISAKQLADVGTKLAAAINRLCDLIEGKQQRQLCIHCGHMVNPDFGHFCIMKDGKHDIE